MLVYILRFSLPGGYICWTAHCSALTAQLELQIIPIEQNILCSVRCWNTWENVCSNSPRKMSCNLSQISNVKYKY